MSFTQGVSGLNAANSSLDTIGNNIANSQTIGFKSGRSEFADIYAGAKTGLGAQVSGVTQNFTGGALNNTGRALDVAIDGGGFFRLTDGAQTLYSRNGQFQQTKEGYIANAQGARLTGYNVTNFNNPSAEPTVAAGGNPVPLQIPTERMNAKATPQASLETALDAGAEITGIAATDELAYSLAGTNTHYGTPPNPRRERCARARARPFPPTRSRALPSTRRPPSAVARRGPRRREPGRALPRATTPRPQRPDAPLTIPYPSQRQHRRDHPSSPTCHRFSSAICRRYRK